MMSSIYVRLERRALASEHLQIDALLESSALYVCQFDRETLEIAACSPGLASALGDYSPADFIGKYVIGLFSHDSWPLIEGMIATGAVPHGVECYLADDEGNPSSVAVGVDLGLDGSGDQLATLVCVPTLDRSALLAQARDEASVAQAGLGRLSDLTRLVVHDIKGMLQVILGSLELIQLRGTLPSPEAQNDLWRIERTAEGMSLMLGQISKFMRLDIGEFPPELTDLNELVDAVIADFVDLPGRQISISRVADFPKLVCEEPLVREAFHNLIENAVNYSSGAGAEVRIGMLDEGERRSFFVRDNGVGIRDSDLEHVLSPLKRADHRKLHANGSGMGLPLVKKIVERHGGEVRLESTVDQGTTVWFDLGDRRQ